MSPEISQDSCAGKLPEATKAAPMNTGNSLRGMHTGRASPRPGIPGPKQRASSGDTLFNSDEISKVSPEYPPAEGTSIDMGHGELLINVQLPTRK
jgi:hypothetical protein